MLYNSNFDVLLTLFIFPILLNAFERGGEGGMGGGGAWVCRCPTLCFWSFLWCVTTRSHQHTH